MKRHYFIANELTYLEQVEDELIAAGIPDNQLHVLSESESKLEIHRLHPVADFMKTDVVRRGVQGFATGFVALVIILGVTAMMGWQQQVGWMPFIFLSIVALGFCTWEGGFLGFQQQNQRFSRFQLELHNNRHVLFVDVTPEQELIMKDVMDFYPRLKPAGSGVGAPSWVVNGQRQLKNFVRWAP